LCFPGTLTAGGCGFSALDLSLSLLLLVPHIGVWQSPLRRDRCLGEFSGGSARVEACDF
jgi:hypothetical protein